MKEWLYLGLGIAAGYFVFGRGGEGGGRFRTSFEIGGGIGGRVPVDEPQAGSYQPLRGVYAPVGAAQYGQISYNDTLTVPGAMTGGSIS